MARNGSGTHNRLYDWATDRDAGILILASRMDSEMDDMALSLTNSIAKDGQTTPTANLPMGSYHFTSLGAGSDATDSANTEQVQQQAGNYAVTTGSSAAYVVALSPTVTTLTNGLPVAFKTNHEADGSATLDVDSLGAKKLLDRKGQQYGDGDVLSSAVYLAIYDTGLEASGAFSLINGPDTDYAVISFNMTGGNAVANTTDTVLVDGATTVVYDPHGYVSSGTFITPSGAKAVAIWASGYSGSAADWNLYLRDKSSQGTGFDGAGGGVSGIGAAGATVSGVFDVSAGAKTFELWFYQNSGGGAQVRGTAMMKVLR